MGCSLPALSLLAGGLLIAHNACAGEAALPGFSPAQVARIIALGPWPPAFQADASNRASGRAAAADFGRRLFHDQRLSTNGYIACVSCHQTDRGWTDAIARAQGLGPGNRNTPALTNAAQSRWFGWSGASDSLWMASLRPILDAQEMGGSAAAVAQLVRTGDGLACEYQRAFGRPAANIDDETLLVDAAKALAAFQETLLTGRTPFDEFRDSLARGDRHQTARYPTQARRGARLFVGAAGCSACHTGPNFSDGSFHAVHRADALKRDAGRSDSAHALSRSRYNLLGAFNDDVSRTGERMQATLSLSGQTVAPGQFRVPSLRNVAVTAPYWHDGSRDSLRSAITYHDGLALQDPQIDDLIAFLQTLTDSAGAARPELRPGPSSCGVANLNRHP